MPELTPGLHKSPLFRLRGQSNFIYPDDRLDPRQCETLKNVNLTEVGTAKTRSGYATFNANQTTGGKDFTGLAQLPFKSGTLEAAFHGSLFTEETGGTRTDRTGTLTLTDNAELRWRNVFIADSMVATNGTDEIVRWTGSGDATDLTSSSNISFTTCRDVVVHNNLLVVLRPTEGGVDQTTRVQWCDINPRLFTVDITNFPVDNRADVYEDGPPIVGGADFLGNLIVFKSDGAYVTRLAYDTGFVELDPPQAVRGFEPIATNSILVRVGNPNFVWFIARDGGYILNPDNSFTKVTEAVQEDWNALNQSRLQYAVSFIRQKDNQVRTLLSGGTNSTGHDKVMVWDWETGDVWFDEPIDAMNVADSWVNTNVEYDMFGSSDGYLYQGNDSAQLQDNGTDFTSTMKMVPNDLGAPGITKNIINLVTYFRTQTGQQTTDVDVFRDEGRKLTTSDSASIGTSQKYNTGLTYNSGLTYGGGSNVKITTFINLDAEVVQPQWQTNDVLEIQAWQCEFEIPE